MGAGIETLEKSRIIRACCMPSKTFKGMKKEKTHGCLRRIIIDLHRKVGKGGVRSLAPQLRALTRNSFYSRQGGLAPPKACFKNKKKTRSNYGRR